LGGRKASFTARQLQLIEQTILEWVGRPRGRPSASHKWEWLRRYYELRDEDRTGYRVDDEPPLTNFEISGVIAEDVDPVGYAKNPGNAKRKVWNLIRPLKKNDDLVLERARFIREVNRIVAENRLFKR
jgi:hypothetical protein